MSGSTRSLLVNGAPRQLAADTVAEVLVALGIAPERPSIAVAVDGAIVARRAWTDTPVADGQRLEIITAQAGG